MDVHKVTLLVVDLDRLGAEAVRSEIESVSYPNDCISPHVIDLKTADCGEWGDDHPLNQSATRDAEIRRLFPTDSAPQTATAYVPTGGAQPVDVTVAAIQGRTMPLTVPELIRTIGSLRYERDAEKARADDLSRTVAAMEDAVRKDAALYYGGNESATTMHLSDECGSGHCGYCSEAPHPYRTLQAILSHPDVKDLRSKWVRLDDDIVARLDALADERDAAVAEAWRLVAIETRVLSAEAALAAFDAMPGAKETSKHSVPEFTPEQLALAVIKGLRDSTDPLEAYARGWQDAKTESEK